MKIMNASEEILETLWVSQVEKGNNDTGMERMNLNDREAALSELKTIGYVSIKDNRVKLLDAAKEYARSMVRRHRLAERLMMDVFQLEQTLGNKSACEFEHIIHSEIEENICTLLGHPKLCPHGNKIPPGKCCKKAEATVESAVKALSKLRPGQKGKVAYIHTGNDKKLHKLMIMGVLPGIKISLLHKTPSYVFQAGNTQVAIDREMADDIYVLIDNR